ncbi:MAG: nucleotide pyrophosphohydrolase [Erysipelotrichaceae bacterium]|nr:nucleotide pyrophosphohydrolase [Erysipelotrichaceae bacterium]
MEINELIDKIKTFCEERDWDQYHNPKDLAIGISTEAAELLDLFRFKNNEEIQDTVTNRREHIEDELADVLFFVLRFAQTNDIDLKKALDNKMAKNAIKYPIDKVKGNNKKYNEY